MATGRRTVVVGQVIDPTAWGNPLWDQSVQSFASAADRTSQFPSPLKGAVTWLDDVGRLEVWNGTAWTPVSPHVPGGSWPAALVGTTSPTKPIESFGWSTTVTTNASGDGNVTVPTGLTLTSIQSVAVIGRGSTAYQITAFVFGSSTLTSLLLRVYNGTVPAGSASIAVAVSITGQRA